MDIQLIFKYDRGYVARQLRNGPERILFENEGTDWCPMSLSLFGHIAVSGLAALLFLQRSAQCEQRHLSMLPGPSERTSIISPRRCVERADAATHCVAQQPALARRRRRPLRSVSAGSTAGSRPRGQRPQAGTAYTQIVLRACPLTLLHDWFWALVPRRAWQNRHHGSRDSIMECKSKNLWHTGEKNSKVYLNFLGIEKKNG